MENSEKSKQTNILSIILFAIAIIACIANSIISYSVNKNYTLYGKVSCDPFVSNCFTEVCAEDDIRCLEYSYDGIDAYFQFAYFNAKDASMCQSADCITDLCESGGCLLFECTEENISMLETENSCDLL